MNKITKELENKQGTYTLDLNQEGKISKLIANNTVLGKSFSFSPDYETGVIGLCEDVKRINKIDGKEVVSWQAEISTIDLFSNNPKKLLRSLGVSKEDSKHFVDMIRISLAEADARKVLSNGLTPNKNGEFTFYIAGNRTVFASVAKQENMEEINPKNVIISINDIAKPARAAAIKMGKA